MTIAEILSIVISFTSLAVTVILSLSSSKKIAAQRKEWQKFKTDLELENQKIQQKRNEILDSRLSNLVLQVKINLEKNEQVTDQKVGNLNDGLFKPTKTE